MPSPKAIIRDIFDRGLDPTKAYTSDHLTDGGRLGATPRSKAGVKAVVDPVLPVAVPDTIVTVESPVVEPPVVEEEPTVSVVPVTEEPALVVATDLKVEQVGRQTDVAQDELAVVAAQANDNAEPSTKDVTVLRASSKKVGKRGKPVEQAPTQPDADAKKQAE